jgi:hypothetical protein
MLVLADGTAFGFEMEKGGTFYKEMSLANP